MRMIRFYALISCLCTLLFSPSAYAGDFRDLEASFSYDGNQTVTVEFCNPSRSDIRYFDGFTLYFPPWLNQRMKKKDSGYDKTTFMYSYTADVAGGFEGPMIENSSVADYGFYTLKPQDCQSHSLPVTKEFIVHLGVKKRRYKFRVYVTLYLRDKSMARPSATRVFPPREEDMSVKDVTFISPVYDYKRDIPNTTLDPGTPHNGLPVYDVAALDVDVRQDGRSTILDACNRTKGMIAFTDYLFIHDPDTPPFGIYLEYKTAGNERIQKTNIILWKNLERVHLQPVQQLSLAPGECKSKTVDLIPFVKGLQDRAAAKGQPLTITAFRPHVAVYASNPQFKPDFAAVKFEGAWVDLKQATGESEALDYNALDVTFKTEGAETAITVCNKADKPVVFRDSLFLDQPEKKPFGLIAEVAYDSMLSKYDFLDRVFYQVSLPRVRDATLEPKECKTKSVNLGRALSVYLRDNPPPEGKRVAQYRPVVVLYEDVWDFSPGKLPHRIFGGEWAAYKGKSAP